MNNASVPTDGIEIRLWLNENKEENVGGVSWWHVTRIALITLFLLVIIAGNFLTIITIVTTPRLRTTTNYIILSLATSDFLLGIIVLPSSLSIEIFSGWIWGNVW